MTENLHHLAELWQQAKAAEIEATARRHHIEELLSKLIPGPDEGTTSRTEGGLKVVVTRELNRTINKGAYEQARELLPYELNPVKTKLDLNLKKYRALEQANPALFAVVQSFVSVKPAKPAIEVKEVLEEVEA